MGWIFAVLVTTAFLTLAILIIMRFRKDMHIAQERLNRASPEVVQTACGPIEYATFGQGTPLLVIHGIFGGFDQGLNIARNNVGEEFKSIIPSRFGYLRSPLPDDAAPPRQADAFAPLLDRDTHADDRCPHHDPASRHERTDHDLSALPPRALANVLFRSNFIFWLLTTYFRSALQSIMGVPKGFELTPQYGADIANVMKTILPVRPRSGGAIFDMYVSNPDINTGYPFEEIVVPILIINARDDPLTLYTNALAMAEKIPHARFLTIENGGHMLLGHQATVRSQITSFLEEYGSIRS